MKNAILYITHHINEHDINQLRRLIDANNCQTSNNDIFVLLDVTRIDNKDIVLPDDLSSVRIIMIDESIASYLRELGYVIDHYEGKNNPLFYGNCMLMVMYAYINFIKDGMYDYVWTIEHDVYFNGKWSEFFDYFDNINDDFIPSVIHGYNKDWWHANQYYFKYVIYKKEFRVSFNPIMRLSMNALRVLDDNYRQGNSGFYEVFLPTLFNHLGMKMTDLCTYGWTDTNIFTYFCKYYWRKEDITKKNQLYHPVKNAIWKID